MLRDARELRPCGHEVCRPRRCRVRSLSIDYANSSVGLIDVKAELREVVQKVVHRMAPEIDGLPVEDQLNEMARTHAFKAYLAALEDEALVDLDNDEWLTVLATRVALVLAFPEATLQSEYPDRAYPGEQAL
jgi:hypothetical protein